MKLSRTQRSIHCNDSDVTIAVLVDRDTFLVPPGGYLQTTGKENVYLAFVGDAPMLAVPTRVAIPKAA